MRLREEMTYGDGVEGSKNELTTPSPRVIISVIICIFLTSLHIKEILHEIGNEYLSNYDVLTGIKNRNSFEHEHMPLPNEKQPPNYYIYADVNGLHEMNNTQGHEAGDEMLKSVASGLKEIFGAENSYRIGRAEFGGRNRS